MLRFDIAGIGMLTLRSNRPQQADQGLEQATARRDTMLVSLGVNSLASPRPASARPRLRKNLLR